MDNVVAIALIAALTIIVVVRLYLVHRYEEDDEDE
jgi:hypothetical protein